MAENIFAQMEVSIDKAVTEIGTGKSHAITFYAHGHRTNDGCNVAVANYLQRWHLFLISNWCGKNMAVALKLSKGTGETKSMILNY